MSEMIWHDYGTIFTYYPGKGRVVKYIPTVGD